MSACKYLRGGRTSHPRHRDRVSSSSKSMFSNMFLTSLDGIGMSSSFFLLSSFATHTYRIRVVNLRICYCLPNKRTRLTYDTTLTLFIGQTNRYMHIEQMNDKERFLKKQFSKYLKRHS